MKVKINPLFIAMAVLVAVLAFIDVGMINPITMPLAGISTFVNNQQANPLILPAAISAGAGLVNGVLGLFSKNKANKQNVALQRETNALNYQMFQEGNAFNRQMAFDMFNAENAYNSPVAQVERLKDANLNPALVAEGATATTGNGDASTPSAAAAAPMVAPSVQPVGSPFENMFDNVEKLASAFQKVNAGNLSTAQKEFVLEQAKSERLDQINKETQNAILQAYGMKDADAKVQKTIKDMEKIDTEITTLVKQGKVADAEKRLKNMQAIAQKNENQLFADIYEFLIQQAQEKVNLLKAQVVTEGERANTERSQQNLNRSASNLNDKQARIAELDADAKEILNEFLPEQTILDMSMKDLDIIDKIFSAGRANNVPNLVDKLVSSGVREDIAKAVNDAMENRKKYLERYHKYGGK